MEIFNSNTVETPADWKQCRVELGCLFRHNIYSYAARPACHQDRRQADGSVLKGSTILSGSWEPIYELLGVNGLRGGD